MIIAELIGGLGNQLFEYAHARALSIKLKQELYFDLSFFDHWKDKDVFRLNRYNTHIQTASPTDIKRLKRIEKSPSIYRKISRKIGLSPYRNIKFHFDEDWFINHNTEELRKVKDFYISGYFAGENYFSGISDLIRQEFTLKDPLNALNIRMEEKILKSNSVSLHIRRGDYINNPFFANIPISYYLKAIKLIEGKHPKSEYFVFSDDLDWVRANLKTEVDLNFVDINNSASDFMELHLMSKCKHNIIANSTFSWWGAWLNSNPEKIVIAPSVWFGNEIAQVKYEKGCLVTNNWIKLK